MISNRAPCVKAGLVFLIIFTPMAFGTVHIESIVILELMILALFSTWLLGMVHRGEIRLIRAPIGLPLVGLLLWAALYLFPLPLDLTKGLLPQFFHPPDALAPGPSYRPLSLYPYATQASLLLGLSYTARSTGSGLPNMEALPLAPMSTGTTSRATWR